MALKIHYMRGFLSLAIWGYERADNSIRKHIDGYDKLMHQISASGQNHETGIINKSGGSGTFEK